MSKRKNKNIDFMTKIFMELEGVNRVEDLRNRYREVVKMYGKDTIINNKSNDVLYFNMNNYGIEHQSLQCYLSYTNKNIYLITSDIIASLEKRYYYEHMNIRIREMLMLFFKSPLFIFDNHENIKAVSCSLIPSRKFNMSPAKRMKVSEDLRSEHKRFYIDIYITVLYKDLSVERTLIPIINDHHIYDIIAEYNKQERNIDKAITLIFLLVDYIASTEYIDSIFEHRYKIPYTRRLVNTIDYNHRKVKSLTSIEETTLPSFAEGSYYYANNGFLWEFDVPFKEYSDLIYKKRNIEDNILSVSSFIREYELNKNRVVFNLSEETFLKLIEYKSDVENLKDITITMNELKELPCTKFTVIVPSKGLNANIKIDFDNDLIYFDYVGECFCLNCISFVVPISKFDLDTVRQEIIISVENEVNKDNANNVFGSLDELNKFIAVFTLYTSIFLMKHIAEVNIKRRKRREEKLIKEPLREKVKKNIRTVPNEVNDDPYFKHKININPITIFEVTTRTYNRIKTSTLRKKGYKVSTHFRSGHYNHYWVGKGKNKKLISKYIPGKIINEPKKDDYVLTTIKTIM